ncbi:hypothetical protein CDL12_08006 [Handroanthus impetiginosus]|uniref:Uncharacterized protein n=1 Tax=Handroanthus impetiginosus TaxID=429701 RepID=A0A2G9HP68_9LAMI|nr:hypothetical protein CDL12_08006 [Handroanthus impetiginosus]
MQAISGGSKSTTALGHQLFCSPLPPSTTCCSALPRTNVPLFCSYKNSKILPLLGSTQALRRSFLTKCKLPHTARC